MERDLAKEIDELKKELSEIKKLIKAPETAPETPPLNCDSDNVQMVGHVQKMPEMHNDSNIMAILNQLEDTCGMNKQTGAITYLGVFASGGRQSNWIRNNINTDTLLDLITNKTAEKVLSCIGNNDRLNILLAILKKPMTVAEIVEECRLNSSGQAYHHMKPLLAADLIKEDDFNFSKGTYVVQPHKVQGIIMLLAGIYDMADETYSKGTWEETDNSNIK